MEVYVKAIYVVYVLSIFIMPELHYFLYATVFLVFLFYFYYYIFISSYCARFSVLYYSIGINHVYILSLSFH